MQKKIFIAGHKGMVGSAILRKLIIDGHENFILKEHSELDLLDQKEVQAFFSENKPEQVYVAAAKVGGILANSKYGGDFIYDNLAIQNNILC